MNQTWIKADIDLGAPEALFVVPMLDAYQMGLMELLQRYDDPKVAQRNLNLLEGGVRAVFGEFRPELASGGTVLSVSAEIFHNWLLIMYSHPRLPRRPVKQTKMMDRYWLIPRPESEKWNCTVFDQEIKTEIPGTITVHRDFDIPLRPVVRGYLETVESALKFKEGWEKAAGVTKPVGSWAVTPLVLGEVRPDDAPPLNSPATLPMKEWRGPLPAGSNEAKILTPIPLDLIQDRDLPKHPRWEDFLCWLYDHQASGRLTEGNRRRLFMHYAQLECPGDRQATIPEELF